VTRPQLSALALEMEPRHHPLRTFASEVWRLNDDRANPDLQILRLPPPRAEQVLSGNVVGFDRCELQAIFNLYGRMVAKGLWRDYAVDFSPTRAIFSIFRRNGELAYYQIVKEPKAARRQGVYLIVMQSGLIMKRGSDLLRLLAALEKTPKLISL